jgi:arginyl-tRNA synthetase
MKDQLIQLLQTALDDLKQKGNLPQEMEADIRIERSRDSKLGDFASNLAMMLAKPAKQKPRDLAEALVAALPSSALLEKVEVAGPGFINFFLSSSYLASELNRRLADQNLGLSIAQKERVVVDYSSPNLAKEMHVGHLRSTIIGDAVARVLEAQGHTVIRQNHVGDWGTQFGMLLAFLEEQEDETASRELADLEQFYRASKQRFDESAEFAERARALVVKLQAGDAHCLSLWREFYRISLGHCLAIYQRLGVSLSQADVRGESAYNDDLPQVVADLETAHLLSVSEGARCVFLDDFKSREGDLLPVIVQKADGGYLYATTDLAAIRYRVGELKADRVLYLVDQRQALHFQQVFEVARRAGFARPETRLEHLGFGTMNGADGKPFKTRTGGTVKLTDLLDEAQSRARALVAEKNPDLPEDERQHIGDTVGMAAVKYADLSKNRTSDYIFSFEQMLSFDGNTAPYLLYAFARIASILRKAGDLPTGSIRLEEAAERQLAELLLQYPEVVSQVAARGTPHLLCTYLYELAGNFSSFYEACPVLTANSAVSRDSRLQLVQLVALTLKQGLGLLGIDTLERM